MLVSIITPFFNEPRTFKEGKRVRARDGLRALWILLRIRLAGRRRRP